MPPSKRLNQSRRSPYEEKGVYQVQKVLIATTAMYALAAVKGTLYQVAAGVMPSPAQRLERLSRPLREAWTQLWTATFHRP